MTARLPQQKLKVFRAPTLLFYFWRKLTIKNFQPFLKFLNRKIILQGFEFSTKLELQLSARPLSSRVFSILDYNLSKVFTFKLLLFRPPFFDLRAFWDCLRALWDCLKCPASLRLFSQALRFFKLKLSAFYKSLPDRHFSRIVLIRPTPCRIFAQVSAVLRLFSQTLCLPFQIQ